MDAYELAVALAKRAKTHIKVTHEFINWFDTVAKYYDCTPEEIEQMKTIARKDMQGANICFKAIYDLIRV